MCLCLCASVYSEDSMEKLSISESSYNEDDDDDDDDNFKTDDLEEAGQIPVSGEKLFLDL